MDGGVLVPVDVADQVAARDKGADGFGCEHGDAGVSAPSISLTAGVYDSPQHRVAALLAGELAAPVGEQLWGRVGHFTAASVGDTTDDKSDDGGER